MVIIFYYFIDLFIDGIGFYVYMFKDEFDFWGYYILVYDVMLINFGNGYNRNIGVFIVFWDGFYFFMWFIWVVCLYVYMIDFIINERIMGSMYVYCGYNIVIGYVVVIVN